MTQVSTRTACSFSSAMQRLGGSVIYMDEYSSSTKKGETTEDAVKVRIKFVYERERFFMNDYNFQWKFICHFNASVKMVRISL